jgi:hypothetical protein
LEGLEIQVLVNAFLVYFTASWYILWPFGVFCDRLEFPPRSGISIPEDKSGNTDCLADGMRPVFSL